MRLRLLPFVYVAVLALIATCAPAAAQGVGGTGGTLGQILIKKSSTNGDTIYSNAPALDLRVAALGAGTGDCTGGAVVVTFSTLIASFENAEVPPGCTLRISATDQIPAGKTFTVRCGGSITVDSGVTLTINAFWRDPGMCQVFQATGANSGAGGTGIIQGLKFNRPEYWGAFGDCQANVSCTHDDAPPIQQCVNSA